MALDDAWFKKIFADSKKTSKGELKRIRTRGYGAKMRLVGESWGNRGCVRSVNQLSIKFTITAPEIGFTNKIPL